jgi:hypothetical protein
MPFYSYIGYYHELFLRGKAFLCHRIDRVKNKGSKPGRIKAYADAEPDFYRMQPMPADETQENDTQGSACAVAEANRATTGQALPQLAQPALSLLGSGSAIGSSDRRPQEIRPIESTVAYQDYGRWEISFLTGQPQPMPLARSSPPVNEECRQPRPEQHHDDDKFNRQGMRASANATSYFPTYKEDEVVMRLYGRSSFSLVPDSTAMLPQSTSSSSGHPLSTYNVGIIQPSDASQNAGVSFFSTLHPAMQASGRMSLETLREGNSAVFADAGGGQGQLQLFMPLIDPATPPVVPVAATPSAAASANQIPHLQGQEQQETRALLPMDMFDMPDDMLSQYLPTAQSLTLSDLFGTSSLDATVTAGGGGSTVGNTSSSQQQLLPLFTPLSSQLSIQAIPGPMWQHPPDTTASHVGGADNCRQMSIRRSDLKVHRGGEHEEEQAVSNCAHQ